MASTTLPIPANTTCDIYRPGNSPPSAPDVAGVKCHLKPVHRGQLTTNQSSGGGVYATHVLHVPAATDVRDGWQGGMPGAGPGTNYDVLYIPNKNSAVKYYAAEVRRVGLGTPFDQKVVYLIRVVGSWPTNDV
jgi:hypothetical protein